MKTSTLIIGGILVYAAWRFWRGRSYRVGGAGTPLPTSGVAVQGSGGSTAAQVAAAAARPSATVIPMGGAGYGSLGGAGGAGGPGKPYSGKGK